MIKIGYVYSGENKYIEQLMKYDLTILLDNEEQVKNVEQFNCNKIMIKYNNESYDVVVYTNDKIKQIPSLKTIVVGEYNFENSKIKCVKELNIDEIVNEKKQNNIKFSVVIPNYNNANWISKGIESILNQTYQNWEMYIIDDVSTDNSVEIVKKYEDSRIKLIENEIKLYNGGSRNVGIMKAKQSNKDGYLLFLDSDDWLANNNVLKRLNQFIDDEDLITLDYQRYEKGKIVKANKCSYKNKDELFMTIGCMCAVWCKCFKVSVAPLFEFNTLMEDRNYHYRLINKINTYSNFGEITHTWNKMNVNSITTNQKQKYEGKLQAKIEWNNCAYRHIAGMLDLLNEITNVKWKQFIKKKIIDCEEYIKKGEFYQL